jgi:hypothetical protein
LINLFNNLNDKIYYEIFETSKILDLIGNYEEKTIKKLNNNLSNILKNEILEKLIIYKTFHRTIKRLNLENNNIINK